jgi:HAE1 family hydrophobic/amphiphilic exporter-1
MNLPRFSVARPVLTTMVTLIVVLLGAVSLHRIQLDLLPNIELPTVSIRTEYEGASPEVMERLVTQIVEEIVGTVPGVVEISSMSAEGTSEVRVSFAWGTDVDAAALELRSRLEDELSELPEGITRPQLRKFDIASFPVVLLGISSKLDPVELTELVETQLRHRFTRIPNIAQADIWGGYEREVRVELDPSRIKALGLPLNRIIAAIRDANLDLPAGQLEQGRQEVTLRAPAELRSLDELRQIAVAKHRGAVVTLGQIARVKDTYRRLTRLIRVNGERGIRLAIRKQSDANTVEVSRQVLEQVAAINAAFPQINVVPVLNQGNFIERSIANVARSVAYGGGLAVAVLLLFLASIRITAVVALSIPISLVATFAFVYFRGLTLNLMTLGGLALGVGMMVDSSIVVLENIFRRRSELGETPSEAAVQGANEVATAIIASSLTTLAVFVPLAFIEGVSGLLFRDLAYVIVFSLICSLVVSLSLLPMLASRLLKHPAGRERSAGDSTEVAAAGDRRSLPARASAAARRITDKLDRAYQRALCWALDHRALIIGAAFALLAGSLMLLPFIGSEFLPPSDEGEVRVTGELEVGARLDLVDRQTRTMEQIVFAAVPETVASVVTVGASGRRPDQASQGQIELSLSPVSERERSNVAIADDLRRRLNGAIPGMKVRVRAPQGQFVLERLLDSDGGLVVEVRGFELPILDALAARAAEVIGQVRGITDVDVTRQASVPQREIRVNREKIADVGLSVRDVTEVLQTAVAGSQAGEYRVGGNSYRILVQLADVTQLPLEDVLALPLITPSGEQVTLRNLVTTSPGLGPMVIDRKDQQRLVRVTANVAGRDLGSVAAEVEERLSEIPRPVGYELLVAGDVEEQQEAFSDLLVSLALALLLIYMVLASQYESLRSPLVVMLSVPVAAVGVLATLFLSGTTLNVQSYIGCIMLGGIVVNNAILLVDQAQRLERDGVELRAALIEAGRRRLRPILMTTSTTILGLLPLALGIGEGSDAQAPLARVVLGGLLGSTPITLVLVPAVFSLSRQLRRRR